MADAGVTMIEPTSGDSLNPVDYDYDLVVIGGGSGGIPLAKEAARLNQRVLLLDYVTPSPQGTSWGLGGTCVNVGCIPKKLMHQTALLGKSISDAGSFGWQVEKPKFNWGECVEAIRNYVGSLSFGYRTTLRELGVKYMNAYGSLIDRHTVKYVTKRKDEKTVKALRICLAMGGRPRIPTIPGAEFGVTSDDIFTLPRAPGKTLVIGASYVALECAGFLAGMGYDVTVMVRSILLRGFDQEIAEKIGENMEQYHGVKFQRGFVPVSIERLSAEGDDVMRLKVTAANASTKDVDDSACGEYNTVLFATGRDPNTADIGLANAGVNVDEKGFVLTDNERTNVWNIFALGDILHDKPELTPTAIQAGLLLARRLYAEPGSPLRDINCEYENVPTTVFTPLEYGCCGLAEEDAIKRYGADNIEVFHNFFRPLEYTLCRSSEEICFLKLITLISDNNKVIGLHILGPNAGEITQGFGVSMKCGLTKATLDAAIGIHPTCAESFTTMDITKRSGTKLDVSSC